MRYLAGIALVLALVGCGDGTSPPAEERGEVAETAGRFPGFEESTAYAGIDFAHDNGASERRYLPETMGAGVAVFDFDGDGAPDLFFVGGAPVNGPTPDRPGALYRNLGQGRFADVTRVAGLEPGLLGMGTAVADVERDGDLDLVVTGVGADFLFRNRGDGTFARGEALPVPPGFSTSAAFLDVDGDGFQDLFLGRYVEWSKESDIPCRSPAGVRMYCTPEAYPSVPSRLLRNIGGGTFEDRTERSGLAEDPTKALGVLPLRVGADFGPDVAVANDTAANQLFVNRGDGSFREEGVERGLAFGPSGAPRGGMGIDGADFDGDGATDVVIGNFALESSALFQAREGQFLDVAAEIGLGIPSLVTLAFGTLAEDFDGDGRPDLLLVNGHIEPRIAETYPSQSYRQRPLLMLHRGPGLSLREAPDAGGLTVPLVGRGAATGDFDGDGAPDLVVTENGGPARIYRNRSPGDRWLVLHPRAPVPFGLEVAAHIGDRTLRNRLVSGRSYLSSPEPTIRLGSAGEGIATATLRWPARGSVRYRDLPVARIVVLPPE
ncbi:MAG: VCBS repeat-containing protein [Thermoanaerobaculia bacterium]|nr:VCBS repeat-containing protein [Thermoanaerobaculia bacterium]